MNPKPSILQKIAERKWEELRRETAQTPLPKLQEAAQNAPPPKPFAEALRSGGSSISVIAEIKKASPSKGVIREDFDHVRIAREYEDAGAAALSVLTDEHFFQGKLQYLTDARRETNLPVLRKDFTLDRYHVWQARAAGADAVLLIAALLDDRKLRELYDLAQELGMDALVEVHDEQELQRAARLEPNLLGVNNRNLNTFETTLETAFRLRPLAPPEAVFVSESGIASRADMRRLETARADAVLIGESLMRADSIAEKMRELQGRDS